LAAVAAADSAAVAAGSAEAAAAEAAPRGAGNMYFTIAAVILCGTLVLWYLLTYNALVKARNAVDQAWSHIEVELKRRLDLVQNLVEIARGYARHEQETFQSVAAIRARSSPFGDASAANTAQPELDRAISRIMFLAENYPQLRADKSFLNLQTELAETENRIAERRHAYNQTVNVYRNWLLSIPSNLVASLQDMPPRSYFDVPDAAVAQPPAVKLT
jgi:LemA protein